MVHFLAAKSGQCTLVLVLELQAKATRAENWGEDPELQQGIIIHIMALSTDKTNKPSSYFIKCIYSHWIILII